MRTRYWLSLALVVALALAGDAAAQDQMGWQPNLEAAQRVAQQTNRLILIHFWAPWCKPCLKLDKEVFANPQTGRALSASFVAVKLNVDESPATARLYGVSGLPTDVVITPDGHLVTQIQSPPTASQYIAQMNQIVQGHRQLAQKPKPSASGAPPSGPAIDGPAASPSPARPAVTQSAYSDDRYVEYFAQRQSTPPPGIDPSARPAAAPQQPQTDYRNNPVTGPPMQPQPAAASPPQSQLQIPIPQPGSQPPPHVTQMRQQQGVTPALEPNVGNPPLGFDGFCPVQMIERKQWVIGDKRWGAIHRGHTYLFAGPEEQKRFLASPEAYCPVMSGNDPVLALDRNQTVPGRREHGLFCFNRIYLFSEEASLQQFLRNPNRYSTEVIQAMSNPPLAR